jgi:hypothetical protein
MNLSSYAEAQDLIHPQDEVAEVYGAMALLADYAKRSMNGRYHAALAHNYVEDRIAQAMYVELGVMTTGLLMTGESEGEIAERCTYAQAKALAKSIERRLEEVGVPA